MRNGKIADRSGRIIGNERPKPNLNHGAGLDVSPAVREYSGLADIDICDWRFVESWQVPPSPWSLYGDNNTAVALRRQNKVKPASRFYSRGESTD